MDSSLVGRTWFAVIIGVLVTLPFLTVAIPPLTDLPGHMGTAAVAAYAGDPTFTRLMEFHWRLIPNLGADIIVAGLRRVVGITRAYWFVAAIIPPLLVAGIVMIASTLRPRGAAALPWALIFIYSYTFEYGFMNYMLGIAIALIGFAAWMRLDQRPRSREIMAWIFVPLLMLCHAVAGCVFVLLVCSREYSLARHSRRLGIFLRQVRPLLSAFVIILLWRLDAHSFAGENKFVPKAKLNELIMLLRDQNLPLDEGSVIAACAIFMLGWWKGARPHPEVVPAILALTLLFVITPTTLSGSSFADERLLPLIPMLAFATQDWSKVDLRLARAVMVSGLALFLVRLAITSAGFIAYNTQFSTDLEALQQVPPYSRIIVLNTSYCSAVRHWRPSRLGHLGDLAIVYRRAWTNSEWDTDDAHLLEIRYRPSARFYDDPSQTVWPSSCNNTKLPTVQQAVSELPLRGIDYLWLLDAALPAHYRNPRLSLRWHAGDTALYAVLPTAPPSLNRPSLKRHG